MTVKVNYDSETTLVLGYYPDSINYVSVPEPYIEIEDNDQDNSQEMCVIDEIYQAFVPSLSAQLATAKTLKISQVQSAKLVFETRNITVSPNTYSVSDSTRLGINECIGVMVDNILTDVDWINSDGEVITMTLTDARLLRTGMFDQKTSGNLQAVDFIDEINACTTLEEVEAINIIFS